MKSNIKYIALLVAYFVAMGCNEYLSETPDNRATADSKQAISELLVNAYPNNNYMEFAETMSDNVSDSGGEALNRIFNVSMYNWEVPIETNLDKPQSYWSSCYRAISYSNQALEAIEKLGNTADLKPLKAEALLTRAYAHFMLVHFWSKAYNPLTAEKDLGIPYVLQPETELNTRYKRNTVKEVYDYIRTDLEEGLNYVTNNYSNVQYHFNKEAAFAFASRFYLATGEWNKIIDVFATSKLAASTAGKFRDLDAFKELTPLQQLANYANKSNVNNLLIVSTNSMYVHRFSLRDNRYQLTDVNSFTKTVFNPDLNLFSKGWKWTPLNYSVNNLTLLMPKFKEYFKVTNQNSGVGEPYVELVLFSNEELYLNYLEALIMTNRYADFCTGMTNYLGAKTTGYDNTTDSVTDDIVIKKFPSDASKLTPFYTISAKQNSYLQAILQERRVEFLQEGLRWFDIKRFNMEVKHIRLGRTANVLLKNDLRRELQIPENAIANGIEKNPR